jgi:hypothetical protein
MSLLSKDTPTVSMYLDFYGQSFDPDEITRRLDIKPTTTFCVGDPMPPTTAHRRRDGWMLEIGPVETFYITELLSELKTNVSVAPEEVKKLCSDLQVEVVVTCVVETSGRKTPALDFPAEFVQWVASLGGKINVDIMLVVNENIDE